MYALFRIPDTPGTIERHAVHRLAGDFAQVYFPSQEFSSLSNNYATGELDPWWRPSRYAPAVHFICAVTICKLDFSYASFLHMFIQTVLFYCFFVMAFKVLQIESDLWLGLTAATFLLFASPTGISWFERGQFSLYVAMSQLLLIVGLMKNRMSLIALSAIFGYVKWTSFPFLFVVMAVHWLGAKSRKELISNTQGTLVYVVIILALSLAFPGRFLNFLYGLYAQEFFAQPEGISLTRLLPAGLVKWLPVALIGIGHLQLRRSQEGFAGIIPFLTGTGILMTVYPTIAHQYSVPTLLCFIPLIFHWAKQPTPVNRAIKSSFLGFMLLASYSNYLQPAISETGVVIGYLATAIAFLSVPLTRKNEIARVSA
jgi:hypothetical protein